MFAGPTEVLKFIRDHDVAFVDLMYVNLYGGLHHVTLPRSRMDEGVFRDGVGADASSIPGFKALESGDASVLPDPATMFLDPFAEHKTLIALCDIVEADTKVPLTNSPRGIARRAEQFLIDSGIGTRSMWGPEFEYYVFDRCQYEATGTRMAVSVTSAELGHQVDGKDDPNPPIPHQKGYHAARPADRLHDLRSETALRLEAAGIPVVYHHHEVGAAGQVEIEVRFASLLQAADAVVKAKLIARMTAAERGLIATFMPKPMFGHAGSGMHFHQHLFKGDDPLFFAEGGYADLSAAALSYVAGLLHHGGAVLGFTNPSTNSYRRLVPGFEAPVKAFFSQGNRSASIRVPRYAKAPHEKRIEFRAPDGTSNPYLAMPAMLMAGLDGIIQKLDPTAMGFGPLDVNVFELPQAEKDKIKSLPSSLGAAAHALQADHEFLLRGEVFSRELVSAWSKALLDQARDVYSRPHPYEFELFLDT